MPALRFKPSRLLEGNVRNRELTIIQRRILRRLRNKKRSIKRKISSRKNLYSYIQSQTTRKLPLFHGDLPITEMHRRTERTSYIPFPLKKERQLVFLKIVGDFLIPTLLSSVSLYLFGIPLVCFCEPGDGEEKTNAEEATGAGPQEGGAATSAAGPSSRPKNFDLNGYPHLGQIQLELLEDLEAIERRADQLHARASGITSQAELEAWARERQELEDWFSKTELALSEVENQDRQRRRDELEVRFAGSRMAQYELDRAKRRY